MPRRTRPTINGLGAQIVAPRVRPTTQIARRATTPLAGRVRVHMIPATAPAKPPTEDETRERLRSAAEMAHGTPDSQATFVMLDLWEKKDFANPQFADGALAASRLLWKQKAEPEMLLFIAGKLARGEWPASPEQRVAAGDFVADLLYGYRRDWRGARALTQRRA